MHARGLAIAVIVAACVPVPPDPNMPGDARGDAGGDAGVEPLLDVDLVTGTVATRAAAPIQYRVEFAADGARMPQKIFFDGVDQLATDTCPFGGGVGIAVFPAFTAAAPARGGLAQATGSMGATGELAVTLGGPVIARVAVTWHAGYTCGGTQQAQGSSTFTLFPSGRIVRHDLATPSTTELTPADPCGCSSNDNLFFVSYWAFDPRSQNVTATGAPVVDGATSANCAVYPDHTIGIVLHDALGTRVDSSGQTSMFAYDWAAQAASLPAVQREAFSAIVLSKETTTARCGDVLADLDNPPIMIGGMSIRTDDDGIYADVAHRTQPFTITGAAGIPSGFAVSLDVGGPPAITRTPVAAGSWYATQADGSRTLVWFRGGLAPGETITIEPR